MRFEDLHHQEWETYQALLNWISLSKHPLLKLNNADLEQMIYLGSFDYQTQGQHKRGQEAYENISIQGQETPCRKGVTGDWKNYFTPRIIERCKALMGDELEQLGYKW